MSLYKLGPDTKDRQFRHAPQLFSKRTPDNRYHMGRHGRHTTHFGEQSLGVGHPALGRSQQCKVCRLNAKTHSVIWAAAFMRSLVLLIACVADAVWQDPQRTARPTSDSSWRPKCATKQSDRSKREISINEKSGVWGFRSCHRTYLLDVGLAHHMGLTFAKSSVLEFGAGCGCYTSYLRDVAHAESVTAYDGIPNIRNLTRGLVSEADLTVNLSSLIRAHDWTLCTEVTEHIPGEFEQTALANIVRPARCGVLLSWAVPGQGGQGHVNEQWNEYVVYRMQSFGLYFDLESSLNLRAAADTHWFKRTLMLFRRPESPARCRESQKSTSVYIYDHDALRLLRPWLSGVSPQLWDDYYELSESPWNVLNRSEELDLSFPDAFLQKELRAVVDSRWQQVRVVQEPKKAELLLFLVWQKAFCLAAGEEQTPCPSYLKLLDWLEATSRWQLHQGRDHVILLDHLPSFTRSRGGVTRRSIVATTADGMPGSHAISVALALPYYVPFWKYHAGPPNRDRKALIGFLGSGSPSSTRRNATGVVRVLKLAEDLSGNCMQGECRVRWTDQPATHPEDYKILKDSIYCPVTSSKVLFLAILAGCIPVIISDLPVFFEPILYWEGSHISVPPADFESPTFSLVQFLRGKSLGQVPRRQARLFEVKSALIFSHGCPPLWESRLPSRQRTPWCRHQAGSMPDAVDYFMHSILHLSSLRSTG
ncbi:unnamed protein product [Symbiodinium necroappetens]|uniref:Exostosin GT47 domain-containing protein n=1 Tax=Symbiodinium necroappetens TaxID=1628268 RepID=A0A812R4T5_9DINO|nr:unnamed protein product [Symbiodinium necroappetens]